MHWRDVYMEVQKACNYNLHIFSIDFHKFTLEIHMVHKIMNLFPSIGLFG